MHCDIPKTKRTVLSVVADVRVHSSEPIWPAWWRTSKNVGNSHPAEVHSHSVLLWGPTQYWMRVWFST